jgi:hypothetical protein
VRLAIAPTAGHAYSPTFSMLNEDTVQYALENTEVILAPERRIQTSGSTTFRFFLVSELMDRTNEIRIRDGHLHAERPQLITPGNYSQVHLDGFGERAEEFIHWLEEHSRQLAVLKYGFQFRKSNVSESTVTASLEEVIARLRQEVERSEDPLSAIVYGVDEGWEVSLLKFATDLIEESAGDNLGDFRRRGLL